MDNGEPTLWWVPPAMIAPILWAIANLLDRKVLKQRHVSPLTMLVPTGLIAACPGLVIWVSDRGSWPSAFTACFGVLLGVVQLLAYLPYFNAVQRTRPSVVVLMWNLTPLFVVALAAALLGERLSGWQYVGLALLVGSTLLFLAGNSPGEVRRAFFQMLPACMFAALSTVGQKALFSIATFPTVVMCMGAGALLTSLGVFLVSKPTRASKIPMTRWGLLSLLALDYGCDISADLLTKYAISIGPVSMVNAFGTLQALWVVVGEHLLHLRQGNASSAMHRPLSVRHVVAGCLSILGMLLSFSQ